MSRISIVDLEVSCCVGITDDERSRPQRLLITVDMDFDVTSAALTDRIEKTINYQAVADRLLGYGEGRSWKLVEKLAANIADMILAEFRPRVVGIEVKKFVIPQARYVSVSLTRTRP